MARACSVWMCLGLLVAAWTCDALRDGECEVCVKTVDKFAATLTDDERKNPKTIEDRFKAFCKGTKSKENRFCYYLGGLEESATGILGELSKPLSWSMPADKVCEKLKKKDAQICDLRFDREIDLGSVDLKKLKAQKFMNEILKLNEERKNMRIETERLQLEHRVLLLEKEKLELEEALRDPKAAP